MHKYLKIIYVDEMVKMAYFDIFNFGIIGA
jgi:hypothetical protein|nr:MAG TPA: hypothetical protein [Caudoviricetes sp.]